MRVKEVLIREYGQHRNLHLPSRLFTAPITFFYGLNETGKSTVHRFVRNLLFHSIHKHKRKEETTTPCLGYVVVETDRGEIRIERVLDAHRNEWFITDQEGRALAPDDLPYELRKYETLYRTVYAFNHLELQAIEELQGEAFSTYIYGAAFGRGQTNIWTLEQEWSKRMDSLFRPRASLPPINQLLTKIDDKQKEYIQACERADQYQPLRAELDRLYRLSIRHKERLTQLVNEREWMLNRLRIQQLEEEISQIEAEQQGLLEQLSEEYLAADRMEALFAERAAVAEWEQEALQIEEERSRLQDSLRQQAAALGLDAADWSRTTDSLSIQERESALQMATQLQTLDRQLEVLSSERDEKEAKLEQISTRLQRNRTAQRKQSAPQPRRLTGMLLLLASLLTFLLPGVLLYMDQPLAALFTFISFLISMVMIYLSRRSGINTESLPAVDIEQQIKQELEQEAYDDLVTQLESVVRQIEEKRSSRERVSTQLESWLRDRQIPLVFTPHALGQCFLALENMQRDRRLNEQLLKKERKIKARLASWCEQVEDISKNVNQVMRQDQQMRATPSSSAAYYMALFDTLYDQYVEQHAMQRKAEKLDIEREQLHRQLERIESVWPDHVPLAEAERLKQVRVEEEDLERLRQEELDLRKEMEELARKRGSLESRLLDLEQETVLATRQQELEEHKAELREETKRWCTYAVARLLCQRTRKMYEEEKQPEVLREASNFFRLMTEGKYERVISPFDQTQLYVIDRQGKRWNAESLSQGAREQLYLSLRFALVQVLQAKAPCPLIMDDIFVHFDDRRTEQALRALVELAKTNQVILFTCHPHLIEKSKRVCKEAVTYVFDARSLVEHSAVD